METKTKVIGIGSIGAVLATLIVLGLNQGLPFYYCENSNTLMHCDSIEKYVIENGKCINKEIGNKICSGNGWLLVVEDELSKETIPDLINQRNKLINYSYNYEQCIATEQGRYNAEKDMGFDIYDNSIDFCNGERIYLTKLNQDKINELNNKINLLSGII